MEKENIISKIGDRRVILDLLEVKRIDPKELNENFEISLKTNSNYKIVELSDEKLIIEVNSKVFFEPEVLFKANMKFKAIYDINKVISEDEVNENIVELTNPIGNELTYLIAVISKSSLNNSIIIPPILNFKE